MKRMLVAFLAVFLFCGVCFMGNAMPEGETNNPEIGEPMPEEEIAGEDPGIVEEFIDMLKERYGEQYIQYYNAILDEWGSIEAYLISAVPEDAPDPVKGAWLEVVSAVGTYAPIWGGALAVIAIVIVVLFGKKALKSIAAFAKQIAVKIASQAKERKAEVKMLQAQAQAVRALLGDNPRFEKERSALAQAEAEIDNEKL